RQHVQCGESRVRGARRRTGGSVARLGGPGRGRCPGDRVAAGARGPAGERGPASAPCRCPRCGAVGPGRRARPDRAQWRSQPVSNHRAEGPRNVLVIMTDQHRVDTIGALLEDGARGVDTPNIDRLAAEGFAFTQAVTPTPICTPARTSLLTGKAPFRHRVLANHEWNIGYRTELPTSEWTYTQELRDAGYNVGLVGKFHVGEHHPPSEFGMDDDSFAG